jgi:hypothetical protein
MGLPPNLLGALKLDFEGLWGPTAILARPAPAASSASSSVAPTAEAASARRLRKALRGVVRGLQASRLREARRRLAMYRQTLPRPEGSFL